LERDVQQVYAVDIKLDQHNNMGKFYKFV